MNEQRMEAIQHALNELVKGCGWNGEIGTVQLAFAMYHSIHRWFDDILWDIQKSHDQGESPDVSWLRWRTQSLIPMSRARQITPNCC